MNGSILTILGVFILVIGLLFIFAPGFLRKLNEVGNTILLTTEKTVLHRYTTGILLLIIALVLIYIAYVY